MDEYLTKIKFKRYNVDYCLYTQGDGRDQIYLLRWLQQFLKPMNIKKEKSKSKAEISSFLLVCVPLGLTKPMKEKKILELELSTQALMGEVQFNVFISPI